MATNWPSKEFRVEKKSDFHTGGHSNLNQYVARSLAPSVRRLRREAFKMLNMTRAEEAIKEIVDRETRAWDTKDVALLISIFHPDMVWPWPPTSHHHDPVNWVFWAGRFNRERWSSNWQELFDTHDLVHNRRETIKIVVTPEGDGGFAVVDVDTLWRSKNGVEQHWKGRACKVYSLVANEWKMTMHTGLLDYPTDATA